LWKGCYVESEERREEQKHFRFHVAPHTNYPPIQSAPEREMLLQTKDAGELIAGFA